jgi:signal transduction histidine kinase
MAGRTQGKRVSAPPAGEEDLFDRLVHDLRNPLGVIAYFADAMSSATATEHAELCVRLRVNAQRALHVLEEFSLLSDLRAGGGNAKPELGDVAAIIEDLAAQLDGMERRPGRIRRHLELETPRSVPRLHVTAALRALLRVALRVSAVDDTVDLSVCEEHLQIVMRITVPLRADPAIAVAVRLPSRGIEVELAQRVAALHGGSYVVELLPGIGVMTLAVPVAG